jgi:hypothetical protein
LVRRSGLIGPFLRGVPGNFLPERGTFSRVGVNRLSYAMDLGAIRARVPAHALRLWVAGLLETDPRAIQRLDRKRPPRRQPALVAGVGDDGHYMEIQ